MKEGIVNHAKGFIVRSRNEYACCSCYAEFSALERSTSSGGIIYNILPSSYVNQYGGAVTEASIAGLTADGNTRLVLRYQAASAGSVTFSVSPSISTLETLDRQAIKPLRCSLLPRLGRQH